MLAEQARIQFEAGVGAGEVRSWQNSLPAFLTDVVDAGLGHIEVLLEHKLPHSPKRVDVVLCGVDPRRRMPSYVVVELKQWSRAEPVDEDLVRIDHYTEPVLHPVEQVRRYCEYLIDATPALAERPDAVHGVAYLHNAHQSGVLRILEYRLDQHGELYLLDTRGQLIERLRRALDHRSSRDDSRRAADEFLGFHHAPSKPLLDRAQREIRGQEQFVLLDEQQVAYRRVLSAVHRARAGRRQTVVIVIGGPGSGKSVIALSLLGELARQGRTAYHATGSSAFTNTLRKVVGRRDRGVQAMFKYFNDFVDAERFGLDVLLCDEAHRIRETSVNRYTRREVRERARRQVTELIDAARVPVFLLDEHQTVRPGELGSVTEIRAAAERLDCAVEVIRLEGQFRCGGSEFYDSWVARLLGLNRLPAVPWTELVSRTDESFEVRCGRSPEEIESWLLDQRDNHGGTARVAAGYCWPWSDPVSRNNTRVLVPDVRIGDWLRPWNAKPGKRVPDAPESFYWASDDRGFGQVGCIYTAQGFEYDWAGVIFGPDFVRRGNRWVPRPELSHDPAVKRATSDEFGKLIRNTYKVLLTRGMRGVCVYSTDPETRRFLESMAR